ncbi:MAG: hypothetical protein HY426_00190 [Candidatus Levybacteria bacterium]|nr:hypothetical protein [Candidatus Levybacteria bacterium]
MRLHEIAQMTFIILLTVVIPVLLLREITQNFKNIKQRDFLLLLTFITGVYFYSTGNGVHELASFMFNHYCNVAKFSGDLCSGLFFNNYYTGNIYYFIGGFMMVASLLLLELKRPNETYRKKDLAITIVNAAVYAFAIFAYAAFDKVLVGITYSVITTIFAVSLFLQIRKRYLEFPVITYTTLTYLLGTIVAIFVRFLR